MAFGDWSTDASSNTTVGTTGIGEGCPPGNLNNAIREVMAQLRTAFSTTLAGFFASQTLPTARAQLKAVGSEGLEPMTANLSRQNAGAHLYYADPALGTPIIYVTAAGAADPRNGAAGSIWIQVS